MRCPICGGELAPFDEKFVVCSTCGAKIPADRVTPAAETPAPAPVEKGEGKAEEKTEEQKRLAELERRLAEMEEERKRKEESSFGAKCKAAFSKVGNWIKGHKKATAFSVLGLLVVITVIVLCVSLCGLRGVYVNENNPYEYYEFGVSSYKCTMPLLGNEVTEEGTYKLSGDKITFTADTELFGTLSTDDDFKKLDGYAKVAIGMNTYYHAGYCLNSKVKITFDANGGEGTEKIKVQLGKMIKETPTPTRVGYRLVGWEDSEGNAFVTGYPIWKKQTYYAQWTECDHFGQKCTEQKCSLCNKAVSDMTAFEKKEMLHQNVNVENCRCQCGAIAHSFGNGGVCERCGAGNVRVENGTVVGKGEFTGGDLILSADISSIGESAFRSFSELTSITIPNSVTIIGTRAFDDCSLTNIYYTGDLAGWCAISGLSNLMRGSYYQSLYIGGVKVEGDLVIPYGVTRIRDYAFYWCRDLTSVTIPDSVTSIGDDAFERCTGLTSVTIGRGVTYVGVGAFRDCSGLSTITVDAGTGVYHSSGNCLIETKSKTLIFGCKSSIIPSDGSVTSIGEEAFFGCTGLTSVTIASGVTSIGGYAFCVCSGLTSINYHGTKAQWNAIAKGFFWNEHTGSYTIHCMDGDIAKY